MSTRDSPKPFIEGEPSKLLVDLEKSSVFFATGGPYQSSATASTVFSTLCDTSTWSNWNSILPKVTVDFQPVGTSEAEKEILRHGSDFTADVYLTSDDKPMAKSRLIVDGVKLPEKPGDPYYLTWTTPPTWLHTGRRFWVIDDLGGEGCSVKTLEFQKGPIGYLASLIYGKALKQPFERSAGQLAKYCEGLTK